MFSPGHARFTAALSGSESGDFPVIDSALDAIPVLVRDFGGEVMDVSSGACRLYGWSREEMLGEVSHCLLRTEFPSPLEEIEATLIGEGRWTGQLQHHRKDGTVLWVISQWVFHPLDVDKKGFVTEVHCEVTGLKLRENFGFRSRAHLDLALEAAELGAWETDDTRTITFGSRARRILGRTEKAVPIEQWFQWIHPEDRSRVQGDMERAWATGTKCSLDYRVLRPDGSVRWISARESPVVELQGGPRTIGVLHDITSRKESERVLVESESRLRRLIEANVVGIVVAGQERILEANDYFLQLVGLTRDQLEAGQITWSRIAVGKDSASQEESDRIRDFGTRQAFEREYQHTDGSRVSVMVGTVLLEVNPEPRFLYFIVDLTGRRKLEEQFRQSQKLESIGLLAGGIAHDFNNLLTVISGYSELLMSKLNKQDQLCAPLEQISMAATRATALTRQLLTFSRRQTIRLSTLNLNEVVRSVERLLSRLIGEDLDLELSLRAYPGTICADPNQMHQVIINLAVNARDAMPNGGKLLIETGDFHVDQRFAIQHLSVQPGDYVMLSVSDNGIGMTPEVQTHIFEPFFTTKDPGKGTGLGLSTVYGIVQQSGGTIWVYSEEGRGATFRMLFPTVLSAELEQERQECDVLPQGSGTILVAEDEVGVRRFVQEVLSRYGYQTITASNGREALELAREHPHRIDLLITDIVMPEMGGIDLALEFEKMWKGVPVLRMSGYTDRIERAATAIAYLEKPFTPKVLIQRVRQILELRGGVIQAA